MNQLRLSSDASQGSERAPMRRLMMGGVLCLVVSIIIAWFVSASPDRALSLVPVNASMYISIHRAPEFWNQNVMSDEISDYIISSVQNNFSDENKDWLRRTATQSNRIAFAEFFGTNGTSTSAIFFELVDNKKIDQGLAPTHTVSFGNVIVVGKNQEATDVIADVVNKKTFSLKTQFQHNDFHVDGILFLSAQKINELFLQSLSPWQGTAFLPQKNLWFELSKKSDHWEFRDFSHYFFVQHPTRWAHVTNKRERLHWYGADFFASRGARDVTASMVTDSNAVFEFMHQVGPDSFTALRDLFALSADIIVYRDDGDVKNNFVFQTPAVTGALDDKIFTAIQNGAAYLYPTPVTRTLPDNTTVTELMVQPDDWEWQQQFGMNVLADHGNRVAFVVATSTSHMYFSQMVVSLQRIINNTSSPIVWTTHCPLAARSRQALLINFSDRSHFPFRYVALVPAGEDSIAGCAFNL